MVYIWDGHWIVAVISRQMNVYITEQRLAKVEIEDENGGKLTFWFNLN